MWADWATALNWPPRPQMVQAMEKIIAARFRDKEFHVALRMARHKNPRLYEN